MKTFEKALIIFQDYLNCDREEEVLKCRRGYLRVTCEYSGAFSITSPAIGNHYSG